MRLGQDVHAVQRPANQQRGDSEPLEILGAEADFAFRVRQVADGGLPPTPGEIFPTAINRGGRRHGCSVYGRIRRPNSARTNPRLPNILAP